MLNIIRIYHHEILNVISGKHEYGLKANGYFIHYDRYQKLFSHRQNFPTVVFSMIIIRADRRDSIRARISRGRLLQTLSLSQQENRGRLCDIITLHERVTEYVIRYRNIVFS